MIAADRLGLILPAAVLASFVVVVMSGYALHSRISFRQPIGLRTFVRYAFAMSANIPLALAVTWLWIGPAGLPMTIAAPLGTICMIAVNYSLSRWAIGRKGAAQ
jgi:putative flippase GtrA